VADGAAEGELGGVMEEKTFEQWWDTEGYKYYPLDKDACVAAWKAALRAKPDHAEEIAKWESLVAEKNAVLIEIAFKNFHRNLCERFGYVHDEKDWYRDLASLEEYIAGEMRAAAKPIEEPDWEQVVKAKFPDAWEGRSGRIYPWEGADRLGQGWKHAAHHPDVTGESND
jgi:hypothetical protein